MSFARKRKHLCGRISFGSEEGKICSEPEEGVVFSLFALTLEASPAGSDILVNFGFPMLSTQCLSQSEHFDYGELQVQSGHHSI